ncbi:MAG: MgtC/SapB family protein [Acidobacteria bacterium]|nr:MgtC/SapB family protein [Acidobacteriota bacterium]
MAEALLIGFLVGAQREAALGERHPGMRDFLLISLVGAVCGLLQQPWFTVAALLSITALLGVFHFQIQERTGITTEMAAVATFCFGYLTATPYASMAIAIAIVVVGFLEAKQSLHKLIRETITVTEFNDTLRFLALIFVIYPLLPTGHFGPYQFFFPRQVWLFVILVSSISYVGYFLTKFLGAQKGLPLASILGGLASTTAATAAFARSSHENPESLRAYWRATVIANSIQFPRILIILYAVNLELAQASVRPLLAMCAGGLLLAYLLRGRQELELAPQDGDDHVELRNPFRVLPALKFGLLFTAILFLGRAAAANVGPDALYGTSFFAGLVDADAISVTLSDLLRHGNITLRTAVGGVLLALVANGVLKTIIAAYAGCGRLSPLASLTRRKLPQASNPRFSRKACFPIPPHLAL